MLPSSARLTDKSLHENISEENSRGTAAKENAAGEIAAGENAAEKTIAEETAAADLDYSDLTVEDLPGILPLYERYLNGGAYIRETLTESFFTPGFAGVKATAAGALIGFFFGNDRLEFTYPHPELEQKLTEYMNGHKYFSPDALFIQPEWRHAGVASELVRRIRKPLQKQGYEYFIVEMWVYPDGTIPEKMSLEQMGHVIFSEYVPDFYKDLDKYGIDCPICGAHCSCKAMIEVMKIHEEDE